MAYKMKGHELPGPNQRKEAPTKFISLIIGGISAIAAAAKKNKEKNAAKRQEARDAMKQGTEAAGKEVSSGQAQQAQQAKSEFKAAKQE